MPDTTELIERLRATLGDAVVTAEDERYAAALVVFYGGEPIRPAAVVLAQTPDDVASTVRLVAPTGVELAIRSGGHSSDRFALCDGGIVLDLSGMKALSIDAEERTAWAETGMTVREYTQAVGELGLATGFGDIGDVGIGGITLGGGLGYLSRVHGLTIDNVLAAEVVTADGELVVADEHNHPDLFWAIRGGGGNFGVVTRFKFRLWDLPTLTGGMIVLPGSAEALAAVVDYAANAPEELTLMVNSMVAPPMPFLPEAVHGKLVIMLNVAYVGDPESAEAALAPVRAIAEPLIEQVAEMPYAALIPEQALDIHPVGSARTMFLEALTLEQAQFVVDHLRSATAPMASAGIRVLGGAIDRIPVDATAYAHRGRRLLANFAAYTFDGSEVAELEDWVDELWHELKQDDAAYLNFFGHEPPRRVRDVYPGATWERLQRVKARYDPDNVFRRNHNIAPVSVG
ncbi:FAD-binding oxidoreductase [Cryobacterium sp. BB307]|uniref:FAD-binding oxidoreductase n=1 Tax=Cryobacterium sp. BB307 TaxID=2716317 RepID=UPI00144725FB|nr:FAD-binding oxidoreductase [Cryobacterium sp. BB307]